MKKAFALVLALCILAVALSGCARDAAQTASGNTDEVTVVFVPKLTGNAFFEAANQGAQAYAEKRGFKVDYRGDPEADVEKQIEIVNQAIEQKASALCISALDAAALDEVMKKAMAAGIKVTTWDSDVAGDARAVMVSQGTPSQLGQMLVEMGAKSLTERGEDSANGTIKYAWHYSQASVTDQNSWQIAGEKYIRETYPNWENIAPGNFYSNQDMGKAIEVGESILKAYPDIDLIICNDSTALPGQAQAAQNLGLGADDVTITGFASPNAMRDYCKAGTLKRWGLWDCQIQGALGCYLAYYLASGNQLKVGDKVNVPDIGVVEVMPNTVLDPAAYTAENSGVVLLPKRSEYTLENVDEYNF